MSEEQSSVQSPCGTPPPSNSLPIGVRHMSPVPQSAAVEQGLPSALVPGVTPTPPFDAPAVASPPVPTVPPGPVFPAVPGELPAPPDGAEPPVAPGAPPVPPPLIPESEPQAGANTKTAELRTPKWMIDDRIFTDDVLPAGHAVCR
jgi:hypothetical protein